MKRVGSESDTFWSLSCQWRNMVFTQCNSRGVIIGFHKCAKIKHQTYLTYPSKKSSKLKIQHIKEKIYLDSRLVRTDSQYIGRFESVHLVRPVMLGAVFSVGHSTATVRCRLAVRKKTCTEDLHVKRACLCFHIAADIARVTRGAGAWQTWEQWHYGHYYGCVRDDVKWKGVVTPCVYLIHLDWTAVPSCWRLAWKLWASPWRICCESQPFLSRDLD